MRVLRILWLPLGLTTLSSGCSEVLGFRDGHRVSAGAAGEAQEARGSGATGASSAGTAGISGGSAAWGGANNAGASASGAGLGDAGTNSAAAAGTSFAGTAGAGGASSTQVAGMPGAAGLANVSIAAGAAGAEPGFGGSTGSGGTASGGNASGGTSASDGGAPPSGGSSGAENPSTGGSLPASGGTASAGAVAGSSGGLVATGGSVAATGGLPATGGQELATGGTLASGGTPATGGSVTPGGAPAVGGTSTIVGGSPSTGGDSATGGAPPPLGGATATGGAASSGGSVGASGAAGAPLGGAGGVEPSGGAETSGGAGAAAGAAGVPSRGVGGSGSGAAGGAVGTGGAAGASGSTGSGGAVLGCNGEPVSQDPHPWGCDFAWGTPSTYAGREGNFVAQWVGGESSGGLDGDCTGCDLASLVTPAGTHVVYRSYFIGYQASALAGLGDCNWSSPPNLCSDGAAWITANRALILAMYEYYAEMTAAAVPDEKVVWWLEPNFIAYTYPEQGAPLSLADLGDLARDITCVIKSAQPNAVVALEHPTWLTSEEAVAYWAAMPTDVIDMVYVTGVGNNAGYFGEADSPTDANAATNTYAFLAADTGLSVMANTDVFTSASPNTWSSTSAADLNDRITEGVVGVLVTDPQTSYDNERLDLEGALDPFCL